MNFVDYLTDPVDKRLAAALTERMKTESIDKISMSEILKEAQVSRSTFYRRYRDKYDLLNQCYQKILDSTLFTVWEGVSYKTVFFRLYTVLSMYPVIFKNALSSQDHNSLRNYIYIKSYEVFSGLMQSHGMDMEDSYNRMLLGGYISGSLEVTCRWAENGMKEPVDLMFKLSYQLMPDEIRSCIALYYM